MRFFPFSSTSVFPQADAAKRRARRATVRGGEWWRILEPEEEEEAGRAAGAGDGLVVQLVDLDGAAGVHAESQRADRDGGHDRGPCAEDPRGEAGAGRQVLCGVAVGELGPDLQEEGTLGDGPEERG